MVSSSDSGRVGVLGRGQLSSIRRTVQRLSPRGHEIMRVGLCRGDAGRRITSGLTVSIGAMGSLCASTLRSLHEVLTLLLFLVWRGPIILLPVR